MDRFVNGLTPSKQSLAVILFVVLLPSSLYLYAKNPVFEAGKQAYLAKDYPQAIELFRPLAESGHAAAQVSLGVMYSLGQGVEKNPLEAVKWFEKAAFQGNAFVQHDLGVRYFKGDQIPKNHLKAIKWWTMAAESGIAESQYNLGLIYSRGRGLKHRPALAAQWYEKASLQEHAHAQYNLAVLYVNGRGVDRDKAKAITLFRQSAKKGIPQAQYNLAVLLESGDASAGTLDEAHRWYQAAADQGINQAKKRLVVLASTSQSAPISNTVADKAAPEKNTPANIISREPWILKQQPQHYTVQLIGARREAGIRQFFKTHRLGDAAAYFEATLNGEPFYKVIRGVYPDRKSATTARRNLSEKLKTADPIIVRFKDIQKTLNPEAAD